MPVGSEIRKGGNVHHRRSDLDGCVKLAVEVFGVNGWVATVDSTVGYIGSNGLAAIGYAIGGVPVIKRVTMESVVVIGGSYALVSHNRKYDLILVYESRPVMEVLSNRFITNKILEAMLK